MRFWNLDLSFTDTFMADKYSKFGPAPRTPSSMQRSYLLSIDFKVTSITEWAAQLKINPLYAILSGFEPGNTPGVGTFYDFINRLWNSDDDHMSPHIPPLKTKVKKPKTKGTKADSVSTGLIHPDSLALAGDGTPVVTSHRERKKRICKCKDNGITDCKCDRYFCLIVISAGILPVTVIIMAMICTCLLILKVTYRYFLIFAVLPNMIHMDSCTLFSG